MDDTKTFEITETELAQALAALDAEDGFRTMSYQEQAAWLFKLIARSCIGDQDW